jgi:hypothetical protein
MVHKQEIMYRRYYDTGNTLVHEILRYRRYYDTACGSYQDFLDRGLLLARNLLNQGFLLVKMKSSLRKFYGYGISVSQITTDMFHLSSTLPGHFLIHDLLPVL